MDITRSPDENNVYITIKIFFFALRKTNEGNDFIIQ